MKENWPRKKIFVNVLLFVVLLFVAGLVVGIIIKSNQQNVNKDVLQSILDKTSPKIIAKLEGNPQTLEVLSGCTDNNNCENVLLNPPFQWIRYSQYYYSKANKQTIPTTDILSDLFSVSDNSFYMRLYQYGDIIIDSKISDVKFKDKYLDIFNNSINSSYFISNDIYNYYSLSASLSDDKLQGSPIRKGQNNGIMSMDLSTNAVTTADAYILSHDTKYLNALNSYLNMLSIVYYFDGNPTTAIENSPKYTACYTILANTKAYSATNDKQYLQLSNDIILGKDNKLKQLYSLAPGQIDVVSTDPMNMLPCLDALNTLSVLDSQNKTEYISTYNTMIDFLINNKGINTDKNSDSFGMMMINNKIDVNSSAWLTKILSENIINNEK